MSAAHYPSTQQLPWYRLSVADGKPSRLEDSLPCQTLVCFASQVDRAEHKSELQTDKMMRAAAKDVHRLRGQSCKEPPEVQSFR